MNATSVVPTKGSVGVRERETESESDEERETESLCALECTLVIVYVSNLYSVFFSFFLLRALI